MSIKLTFRALALRQSECNIVPRIIILPFNHFEKKNEFLLNNNELSRIEAH